MSENSIPNGPPSISKVILIASPNSAVAPRPPSTQSVCDNQSGPRTIGFLEGWNSADIPLSENGANIWWTFPYPSFKSITNGSFTTPSIAFPWT